MNKINVGVIFGGASSEHSVSLVSATSVINHIPQEKYQIVTIGITKDGCWYHYTGDSKLIASGEWEQSPDLHPCAILPDSSVAGLRVFEGNTFYDIPLDVVFPVLHGRNGEDGRMQGLLMMGKTPYVGCDLISSANCMDKAVTHTLLDHAGIPQVRYLSFLEDEFYADVDAWLTQCEEKLGYPCFVKPANAGSSVGISKAKDRESLKVGIQQAFQHDKKLVIEQGIDGREIECAVLGNSEPISSVLGEIAPANEFYDFEAKYVNAQSELTIEAPLDEETSKTIRQMAVRAYQVMGCEGMARVDFFVDRASAAIYLNEINTIPGFTSISMYPKLFEASGVPYRELLDRLIQLAMERGDA